MIGDKQPVIFIIDDDEVMSKYVDSLLKNNGFKRIYTFPTGEECLANLTEKPDIVILDYNLSSSKPMAMNGMITSRKLTDINRMVAIIMLSGEMHEDPNKIFTAKYGLGIHAYFHKNLENMHVLINKVKEIAAGFN